MKKLSNTEAELKKSVAYKKKGVSRKYLLSLIWQTSSKFQHALKALQHVLTVYRLILNKKANFTIVFTTIFAQ